MHLDDQNIRDYLQQSGWLGEHDPITVEPAGDANINYVRRVRKASGESVVVKQARLSLERFPQYQVTTDRMLFEHRYGQVVRQLVPSVASSLPAVYHFDMPNRVLMMEDLGDAPRLDQLLDSGEVPIPALQNLGEYLAVVHATTHSMLADLGSEFDNLEMRSLHGEHIFTLPFQENDFPVPAAVRDHARQLLSEPILQRIHELRDCYYQSAEALVHGDVQSGNLLIQGDRPRLLDAEIAHVGDPAFDLGTLLAHLHFYLATGAQSGPLEAAMQGLLSTYFSAANAAGMPCSQQFLQRARHYAAVEMLRRTLGVARLPVVESQDAAIAVVSHAAKLLTLG